MSRNKVLVLFGGESSEHAVSVSSATNIVEAMNIEFYEVFLGYITEEGEWQQVKSIDTRDEPIGVLRPMLGKRHFIINDEVLEVDVILPVLHGKNGEDGSVAALGQLLHIPVVGCDMTAGAVAMDKYVTKQLVGAFGVPIVPFVTHRAGDEMLDFDELREDLGSPLFVKPSRAGSSVGVHKVSSQSSLVSALEDAHRHDDRILIEKAIDARELEVAVLGNYPEMQASSVGEIIPDGDFYSYESKYDKSSKSAVAIPADIPDHIAEQLQEYALSIFEIIGGSGLARIDFFIDKKTEAIWFNEVNTFPGFTNISMYPKLWEAAGVSYSELIERLIALAIERGGV